MVDAPNPQASVEKDARYPCCPHCADALTDHVEHGGTVEKDGHDLPCSVCEYERRTLPQLAQAFEEGVRQMARAAQGGPEPVNLYRVTPPSGGHA